MKGLIHLYTGEGKGKTTAALGLALRAAGNQKRVVILQFCKGSDCGEARGLSKLDGVTLLRNSQSYGFYKAMSAAQIEQMRESHNQNLQTAVALVEDNSCDLLVLDEVCAAYRQNTVCREQLDKLILQKPTALELVLTGRQPPAHFFEAADYISEIKKIKHPFDNGVAARKGVEY